MPGSGAGGGCGGRSGRVCGSQWCLEKASSCTPHIPSDTPVPGPLRQVPPFSPTLSSVPREGSMSPASPCQDRTKWGKGSSLAPNRQGQGSLLWLMSQQASSQILSLFSFLLHEMGIINEKQRGTGRGGGGTELLACLSDLRPHPRAGTYTILGLD